MPGLRHPRCTSALPGGRHADQHAGHRCHAALQRRHHRPRDRAHQRARERCRRGLRPQGDACEGPRRQVRHRCARAVAQGFLRGDHRSGHRALCDAARPLPESPHRAGHPLHASRAHAPARAVRPVRPVSLPRRRPPGLRAHGPGGRPHAARHCPLLRRLLHRRHQGGSANGRGCRRHQSQYRAHTRPHQAPRRHAGQGLAAGCAI